MDTAQKVKSAQEQAVASWITNLNQLRIDELLRKLSRQDSNLEESLSELEKFKKFIGQPEHILGSSSTKHGEIAEQMQVNFSNAERMIRGLKAEYTFENVGRLDGTDYVKNGSDVQSKFLNGLKFTLNGNGSADGIAQHLQKYPDFVKNGGSYDIPKDQYDLMMEILNKDKAEIEKSSKEVRRIYKAITEFQEKTGLDPRKDIKPAVADYKDAQLGTADKTLDKEIVNINEEDKKLRQQAYDRSKPSLGEGMKASVGSAVVEGGVSFCLKIVKKRKEGKNFADFTDEDWKDIGIETGKGAAKGGIRGGVIYVMTNFSCTPSNVASALVTAAFGTISNAEKYAEGEMSKEDFIVDSEACCMDASIAAVSALLGEVLIPVPVIGAVIGTSVGNIMYDIVQHYCDDKTRECIKEYYDEINTLNKQLDEKYRFFVEKLEREYHKFSTILELAFDKDVNVAFNNSIILARMCGVPEEKILKTKEDIDNYFLG